ncbi:hypothetical protein FQN50_005250 [Emmonsiellopsis sp. PD_5]|nr:hypothetical protein FQN50_005250 [Emmonsiellopsis sp. PD_5]
MNTFRFWKQTCGKIGSRCRLGYTSLAPLQSRITKPLVVASPGNYREENIRSYVTYNARCSTSSALKAPATEVHDYAIEELRRQMMGSIEQAFPSLATDLFVFRIESRQAGFDSGDKSESMTKVPDASLRYMGGPHFVHVENSLMFQIGFREEYSSLKRLMKLWLDGNEHVQAVLLIKFTEKPQYRTPIDVHNPPVELQEDAQLPIATVRPELVQESGRILIHGKVFANRMTGFCELWVRSPYTGKPEAQGERTHFYDSDSSVKPPELKIDFDTCFPKLRELQGKGTFVMDWGKMASAIQRGHMRTAIERYLLVLKRCRAKSRVVGN